MANGSFFRYGIITGLSGLFLMAYWSYSSLDTSLRALQAKNSQIENKVSELRSNILRMQSEVEADSRKPEESAALTLQTEVQNSKVDPSLPNLLEEDLFFSQTLPKLQGEGFMPSGTLHLTNLGLPDTLHPFTNFVTTSRWISQCSVSAASSLFGKYETLAPDMAYKIEERKRKNSEATEFWIFLRDKVFWQPLNPAHFSREITLSPFFLQKHQVTAYDFKFYYDVIMNPHVQATGALAARENLKNIEELEVIDKTTFVVRFKTTHVVQADGTVVPKIKYTDKFFMGSLRPLASFVYQYFPNGKKIVEDDSNPDTYRNDVVWAQNFAKHWASDIIVSCGPWIFEGKNDRGIKFKRNADYFLPGRANADAMEVSFKGSPDAMWIDFMAGKVDVYTVLATQLLGLEEFLHSKDLETQIQANPLNRIKTLEYVPFLYYYIGWNEARPLFKSKKVRQAMTMAIDRKRIVDNMLNGKAVLLTGPSYPFSKTYNSSLSPWPYDPQAAQRLLEEEGWYDRDGSGVISKIINGKTTPFRFNLDYGVKSTVAKPICEYIASALKEIGVECHLNGIELADFISTFSDKNFDASFRAWVMTFPLEFRAIWGSKGAKEKGSQNGIGFVNKEADTIIDQLDYEYDPRKRIELYHRFHALIHEEQPYTFLFIPTMILAYREYVQGLFIPSKRQDLIPGADVPEPDLTIEWLKK